MTKLPDYPPNPPEGYDESLCWPPRFVILYLGDQMGGEGAFDTEEAAQARITDQWSHHNPDRFTTAPTAKWRDIQMAYRPYPAGILPVWTDMPFWQSARSIWQDHFVEKSTNDATLLTYVQSVAKGQRGIRTPIKPGKYLRKYFSDILSDREIADLATWQSTGNRVTSFNDAEKYVLGFATSPDDIEHVYTVGPESCMSGPADAFDSSVHPARIYGAGDLAVAYLTEATTGRIRARALVWPSSLHCGRIYPTPNVWSSDGFTDHSESSAMQAALGLRLRTAGYSFENARPGGFNGARLQVQRERGRMVMPYLDNAYGYDLVNQDATMDSRAPYDGSSTTGLSESRHDGSWDDDDDDDDTTSCGRCDRSVGPDDTHSVVTSVRDGRLWGCETWCGRCVDNNAFYCEGLEETVSDNADGRIEVRDVTMCQSYAISEGYWQSDYGLDWYSPDDNDVTLDDGSRWTTDEFEEHGFTCAVYRTRHADLPDNHHPDIPEAHRDVFADDLEVWLAERTIVDTRQEVLELAA